MNYFHKNLLSERRRMADEWASELGAKLGRSEAEIREKGLSAYDFSPTKAIEIKYEDGSYARYESSFMVNSDEKGAIAIFTEHCGYFILPQRLDEINEIDKA